MPFSKYRDEYANRFQIARLHEDATRARNEANKLNKRLRTGYYKTERGKKNAREKEKQLHAEIDEILAKIQNLKGKEWGRTPFSR